MQLRKNHIRFSRINHIFISHLHGDHIFGLYGLLSTFSLMGRKSPLSLYAPSNYDLMLISHLSDFDIHLSYEINFVPLAGKDPVEILNDKYLTVTSFPLKHRVPSFGFLFREKNHDRNIIKEAITTYNIPGVRLPAIKKGEDFITASGTVIKNEEITIPPPVPLSYAYCSDTKYFKRLASFVKDVSLLYHEATFDQSKQDLAAVTGHSTTLDAARTAVEAGAGKLIIGHFSARYKDVGILLKEARSVFPNTLPAEDGMTYNIADISNG
jgi:ribonuclease Z